MHQPPLKTLLFSLGAGYQSGSKAFGLFVVSGLILLFLAPNLVFGSAIQYLVGATSATTFTIDANNLPADGTTYEYYYHVMSKNADPF